MPAGVILQALPALETGGVERETVDIAKAQVMAGFTALVVSSGGKMVRELEQAGAEHITLPVQSKNPAHIHENAGRLAQLLAQRGVSLVHARSRAPAWAAYFAAGRLGLPLLTTFHGAYNTSNPFIREYNSVMVRGCKVIAVSDFIADHVRQHYPLGRGKLVVIHRGIDVAQFDAATVAPERVERLKRLWGVEAGQRVVMLPGRVTWLKGQGVLINAMAALRRQDVLCVLVGSDLGHERYRQMLERQARRRGLAARVRFVGECDDMPAAYLAADAAVSASTIPEAFGRVLAEALALGCPAISADHGGGKEILETAQAGWLVQPRDPQALAQAIDQALSLSGAELQQMRERAVSTVRERYDMRRMCGRTIELYGELLGGADVRSAGA
jgi:glycosyltransferase involved in cell wall biosynthesis